jgi:DNA polymerase-3 subunit alpha
MYSLLEALPSPGEIVQRARELQQNAVALTDKGYTYGLIEFYKAAREQGIKPILGMDVYIAARTRLDREPRIDTRRFPLTLLAETLEGYQNLLELATRAALEGMYYQPRVDAELLQRYGRGLLAMSGAKSGAIPQAALAEDGKRLKELVDEYQSFFGKGNLYFELIDLPNVAGQAEVNQQLIRWGRELGVPLVVTCNSHYARPEDAEAHDVLLCIQKNALVHDTNRFTMLGNDYSMRPYEELARIFAHVPEALTNTRVIADRCSVELEFGTYQIPRFVVPEGETESSELRKLCIEGALRRYGGNGGGKRRGGRGESRGGMEALPKEVQERLDYELQIIDQVGFAGYFLIIADIVRYAKGRGITVGPGRGSAAGSIVSYCLDITTLDPLEHRLLFERFLNPERITMPDIDLDFADNRREEVLAYVTQKYGADHVVQICTFGTLAARAAVKDVGRAYGVPFAEMNELAKLIPMRPGTQLREAIEASLELRTACESNDVYRKIIEAALKLEGKTRHVSVHACGVIITKEPTVRYTALQRAPKDEQTVITQYSAKPLEALGLLKMDFLGLKNLTIIQTTLEIIERLHGKKIALSRIPLDDRETFALLARGDTTGVFQLESPGMRRSLKQLKPTEFGDITAMVSLFRPGPMEWIPEYIARKHGERNVEYLHEDLQSILEPTYGIGIYQEQILEIARLFAGYSLGQADILRRAIGKKIKKELAAQRKEFLRGAERKGYDRRLAERIFDDIITPFAGYGFNKSHAACYARIAYETAYLKAHYPTEFMAAMLSADAADTDRIALEIDECRAMGIEVLPPDINESFAQFTALPGRRIRFGLTAIKGVGESTVEKILEIRQAARKFTSIEDFARRVPSRLLNKKFIEALAKSGALDSLGDRSTFVEHYPLIAEFSKASGDIGLTQTDLFSVVGDDAGSSIIKFPQVKPVPLAQRLQWEKETLGLYVSSHPLAGLTKYIGKKAQLLSEMTREMIGRQVIVAGIIEGVKRLTTRKGEAMGILSLEDPTGKIEVTLFPRTFAQASSFLDDPDSVLVVGGKLEFRAGAMQVVANAVKKASLARMVSRAREEGFFDEEEARRGLTVMRAMLEEPELLEALDEEGNIIAGETIVLEGEGEDGGDLVGPLASFIARGMPMAEPLRELGFDPDSSPPVEASGTPDSSVQHSSPVTAIRIHTVVLPEQAPKQLLLDLKSVLQRFPGKERIQLKIGSQCVPLPLTVTMSAILEKKIDEAIQRHSVPLADTAAVEH